MGARHRNADALYPSHGRAGYDEGAAEQARQALDAARPADDGGPAFPAEVGRGPDFVQVGPDRFRMPGMSLRDYFAATALQVACGEGGGAQRIAAYAYAIADAMLAQRAVR